MPTKLSQAILTARHQVRLTQKELGARVGVKASAVLRWEAGRSKPPARRRPALARAIGALDAAAGARLQAALDADAGIVSPAQAPSARAEPASAASAPRMAAPPMAAATVGAAAGRSSVELLVYRMADELDLPPRRVRGALTRWLRSSRALGLGFEQIERELEAWLQRAV